MRNQSLRVARRLSSPNVGRSKPVVQGRDRCQITRRCACTSMAPAVSVLHLISPLRVSHASARPRTLTSGPSRLAVGSGGLPSRGPVGKISRAMVVELADRKIAEMQAQQRALREKARLAPPLVQFAGSADPVRARILKTQCATPRPNVLPPIDSIAEYQRSDAPWAHHPAAQTRVYSPIGTRHMRCASAETARFEVALAMPERARSSPPRRSPVNQRPPEGGLAPPRHA